ncbi:hypothetical protein [Streptomyces tendae]|uniref:hypothetical protein n=1 Tax=Streptomyces tendae TaxID=1932 RepID=UPI003EBFF753
MTTTLLRPRLPMPDSDAAWVRAHVLAPKKIPPAWHECPCQGLSNACDDGRHTECGHDQWVAWWGRDPETVIQRYAGSPCAGAFGLNRGQATVYLADRECWTRCNCHCHQPPPEHSTAPPPEHTEQLDLFQEDL